MPITRRQFELGIDPAIEEWMEKLYDFLKDHKAEAYSADELEATFRVAPTTTALFVTRSPEQDALGRALAALLEIRAIDTREVRGVTYYAFKRPVDKSNWL